MEDLIKSEENRSEVITSNGNAREMALELSFDQSAFESLSTTSKKKRRKETSIEAEAPEAKKSKVSEVGAVDPVLLALQMKKNAAREIAKKATGEEEALQAAGPFALKHKLAAEEKAKQREFKEKLEKAGVDPERYSRLHETQETVDAAERRKNRRLADGVSGAAGGPSAHHYASSFERRSKDASFDREAYEAQKTSLGEDFYGEAETGTVSSFKPDSDRVDAMVSELAKQSSKRKEFHRRRTFKEDEDITFINEANRKLNQKLERQYGKATAAIKDSLERGTAL